MIAFRWIALELIRIDRIDAALAARGATIEFCPINVDTFVGACACRRRVRAASARTAGDVVGADGSSERS